MFRYRYSSRPTLTKHPYNAWAEIIIVSVIIFHCVICLLFIIVKK